jgi:hypothetical protein
VANRIEAAVVAASYSKRRQTMTTKNKPTHRLYAVSKNGFARAIGAAWPENEGEGLYLKLDFQPLNGARIVLREAKAEEAEAPAEAE